MKRLCRHILLLFALGIVCSCVGAGIWANFDPNAPNTEDVTPGGKVVKPGWQPSECTIDQVRMSSFKIKAARNEKLLSDITFTTRDGVHYVDSIKYYKLDNMNLVATWDCVAAKVTVGETAQIPDSTVNDFSKEVVYRLYASDGQFKEYTYTVGQSKKMTGMTVVSIVTEITDIGSYPGWREGIIKISGQDTDYEDVQHKMSVKARGNNSAGYAKQSYTVKLSERAKMLGMKKHKRWTLIANAADKTLLRNCVAYEIASRTGLAWTPHTRHCELFVNGSYRGLYLMVEQIRVDKNRVAITEVEEGDDSPDAVTGGFLLEFDRYSDDVSFKTAVRELPVNIKYPEEEVITKAQIDYIKDYVKKIEQALYQKEVPDTSYRSMIDMASFADAWIVLELTHCRDARLPGSIWYYKDRNGPLCAGPVWDFDLTTFIDDASFLLYNYEINDYPTTAWSLWYSRLFRDDKFKQLVKERWIQYMPSFESIPDFIDEQAEYIRKSAGLNYQVWPNVVSAGNPDSKLSWEASLELMKSSYLFRLDALNKKIMAW